MLVFQHSRRGRPAGPTFPALWVMVLALVPSVKAQSPAEVLRNIPKAQVLVLGVFHFQDAGLDAYKPQFPFDIRSPERQRELDDVLERLARWQPSRILIEQQPARQARIDSLYQRYPGGGLDTLPHEIYQVGFRLARRLGHPGLFAIDAPPRRFESTLTDEEWRRQQAALRRGPLSQTDWNARYTALYRYDDSLKTVRTLRETLLYINDEERLRLGHGHYLVGDLLNGEVDEFFGADGFVSAWHNRNLRIYSNVVRLIRSPEERLLVIIGAGHVPILRHALQSSPAVTLVNVDRVLR